MAFADELDDKQAALEAEAARVQQSLEFVDSRIAKAAGDLVIYQGQLPGAQQALLEAQGRVASAVKEVEALTARVDLAQQNKAKITQQLEADKQKIADTKKLIGQIATQAYKSGGVPSNLTLFFGANNGGSLTDTMDLADQAMRSQNAAMDKLSQQSATNVNSQARLEAVEAEIQDLKAKADAALEREKAARDEAAAKKAQVDQLIADTTRLDAELQAAKPGIQSQMAAVEASQNSVANEIAERDRRLREAWEAEQRRLAEARRCAPRRAQGPGRQPYAPVTGSPSAFACGTRSAATCPSPPASAGVPPRREPSISTAQAATCTPASTLAQPAAPPFMLRQPARSSPRAGIPQTAAVAGEAVPWSGAGELADHHLLPQQQHCGLQRPAGLPGPADRVLGQHRQLDGLPRTLRNLAQRRRR